MTLSDQHPTARDDLLFDNNGWLFWPESTPSEQARQLAHQRSILSRAGGRIGE